MPTTRERAHPGGGASGARLLRRALRTALLLVPVLAARGAAQQVHDVSTGSGATDEYGASVARVGDLDGDGADELAVGAPGEAGTGIVRVLSGRDGSVLMQWAGLPDAAGPAGWAATNAVAGTTP